MEQTYEVNFSNRYYHLQSQMIDWCNDTIGKNPKPSDDWCWNKPTEWEEGTRWSIASAFGNTFFYFKHAEDASAFILKWK